MSLTILIVGITTILAGLGFWFYNRRQINSLTESIEDKNAVISSFREHLSTPFGVDSEFITSETNQTKNSGTKKKRNTNRPKKSNDVNQNTTKRSNDKSTKPNPNKNGNGRGRKPKKQQ
jgi:hypothetical protein